MKIKIADRWIGDGQPVFTIAEIGVNHNGSLKIAKQLIDLAVDAGADCVKFQKRTLEDVYQKEILDDPNTGEQAFQYAIPILKSTELSDDDYKEIVRHCKKKEIIFNCTPWDRKSADFLEKLGIEFYKIGSPDMTNTELIKYIASKKKPIIISTGMSRMPEIRAAVETLKMANAEFILLHCNSTYPAPPAEINLNFMGTLKKEFGVPVGYSGHERGIAISSAAVAMGACVIERHLTLDRDMEGPDHKASLEPGEFKQMVHDIKDVEEAKGSTRKHFSRGEILSRDLLAKSLLASRDLKKGEILKEEDIIAKSPGKGLSPQRKPELIGKILTREIKKEDYFIEDDIEKIKIEIPKSKVRWGLKVRYNDIDSLMRYKPALVEFHFTDKDLDLPIPKKKYDTILAVHAPEYYKHDLLDFCTEDERLRKLSVKILQKTIDKTNEMKKYFNDSDRPFIVFHAGGMSIKPIKKKDPKHMKIFLKSLSELDQKGIELVPENQVPRPWFFGGQWYLRHFMDPDEIKWFCETHGYGICFDIAHAQLYCNLFRTDLNDYIKTVIPFTKEVHLADAYGLNGEGVQIGEGDIDWKSAMEYFKDFKYPLIPEIWRGHLLDGKDFIIAMNKLIPYLK